MSDMFYEEETFKRPARAGRNGSKMSQWLIDKGIVKSESAASMVLIGVAVVAIAITFWIIKGDDIGRPSQAVPTQSGGQVDFEARRAERLNQ